MRDDGSDEALSLLLSSVTAAHNPCLHPQATSVHEVHSIDPGLVGHSDGAVLLKVAYRRRKPTANAFCIWWSPTS